MVIFKAVYRSISGPQSLVLDILLTYMPIVFKNIGVI